VSLAFSRGGRWLASGSGDGLVNVWDVQGRTCVAWYAWHQGEVRALAFLGEDRPVQVVSGGGDGQVIVAEGLGSSNPLDWPLKPDARLSPAARLQPGSVQVLARTLSPDGKLLATGDTDRTVLLWDPQTGALQRTIRGVRGQVARVAFSPGGDVLASLAMPDQSIAVVGASGVTWHGISSQAWQVKLWEPATGKERGSVEWSGNGVAPVAVAVSPEGRWAAVGTGGILGRIFPNDPTFPHRLVLWDVAAKKQYPLDLGPLAVAPNGATTALAFDPDGGTLASGSAGGRVALWGVDGRKPGLAWQAHTGEVLHVAFAPDGKTLATTGKDRAVHLWNVATGKLLLSFPVLPREAGGLAFSPDGTALTALAGEEVRTWHAVARVGREE
jgi:WD40 repeat protein